MMIEKEVKVEMSRNADAGTDTLLVIEPRCT